MFGLALVLAGGNWSELIIKIEVQSWLIVAKRE